MSRIVWHIEDLTENACKIADLCRANGISLALVSKFCLSYQPLVLPLLKTAKITTVCDSNCSNFGLFPASNSIENEKKITKTLIKTTAGAIKSLPDLPPDARPDRVFVSHTALLDAIRQLPHNIMPQVVLIAENGDLKEGFDQNQICSIAENYADLDIIGVSSNFSCLTGGLPQIEDVEKLAQTARKIAKIVQKPEFLSLGGTVMYDLLKSGRLKNLVQELRMGEGIFFGYNSSKGCKIKELSQSTAFIQGEILETAEKYVENARHDGFTALGKTTEEPPLTGLRTRAVLDFGVLAAGKDDLTPADSRAKLVGQTFDFTVLDITDSSEKYFTGGFAEFAANYASASQAMLNPFVTKIIE